MRRHRGLRYIVVIASTVGNFEVLLGLSRIPQWLVRLSRISPCCYGCREFRRVATVFGNSPCCYAFREFSRAASITFYCCREFRRVATSVGNFAVLLRLPGILPCWLSGISSCCYGCREFAVLMGFGNFVILLQLSGISPC